MNSNVMAMNSQHIVEEVLFDVSFPTEDEAFAEQAMLSTFVTDTLMSEVDDAFNDCSDDHSILRIDRLEVDLGVVPYLNYQGEMADRLRERLRQQLREYQAKSRIKDSQGVVTIESTASDLETLQYFIRNGYLPWHCQAESTVAIQLMFMRVIESQGDAVVRLLTSTLSPNDALDRLADLLPQEGLIKIARLFLHEKFDTVALLLAHLADCQLSHRWLERISTQSRNACLSDLWTSVIGILLRLHYSRNDVSAVVVATIKRCTVQNRAQFERVRSYLSTQVKNAAGKSGAARELDDILGSISEHTVTSGNLSNDQVVLLSAFITALDDSDAVALQRLWTALLSDDKSAVAGILRRSMLYASCRNRVIEKFSEAMLYEWCAVIDHTQVGYIKSCQDILVKMAMRNGSSGEEAYRDFWGYALLYFGSYDALHQFDREQFLYCLCECKGANFIGQLIETLGAGGQAISGNGDLQEILSRFQQQEGMVSISRQEKAREMRATTLSESISSGDATGLNAVAAQWDYFFKTHSALLSCLVRLHGGTASIRSALVRALSSDQLRDLVGLLDPGAKEFVDTAVALLSSALSSRNITTVDDLPRSANQPGLRDEHRLWGFTFDFFMIERGSRFNKKEYCGCMLREMAAHNNCSYRELLSVMQQRFAVIGERNRYARELLVIIDELAEEPAQRDTLPDFSSATIPANESDVIGAVHTREFLLRILEQDQPLVGEEAAWLERIIEGFLSNSGASDIAYVRELFGNEKRVRRISTYINEVKLKKMLSMTGGERYRILYPHAELLIDALENLLDKERWLKLRRDYLVFCSRYIFSGPRISPAAFIRVLANYLIARSGCEAEIIIARLITHLSRTGATDRRATVLEAIKHLSVTFDVNGLQQRPGSDAELLDANLPNLPGGSDNNHQSHLDGSLYSGAAVYIKNAGQVLLAPYLPTLFERLGLVERGEFSSQTASARAVHALQYMVDGVGEAPEYMMVLNKLICGVESARPVMRDILVTDEEKALIDGLLSAAIENWKGVGNTSVGGLRDSFLKREGRLQLKDDQWHLLVEPRSYDMLLDRLPWSYTTIKYSWMPRVIHVEWR